MNISNYLLLTFGAFSLGQLGRISFFNQEINFYLYEPLLAFGLLYFIIKYGIKPLKSFFNRYKIIFFFVSSLLISYFISFFSFSLIQNFVSILYFIRFITYLLFFLYLSVHCKKKKLLFTKELLLLVVVIIITSFIQFIFYPDLQNLVYLGWDPHFNRLFGVFFDTSTAAAIFGLLFIYMLMRNQLKVALLLLIALILTFARSSYLVLFIALFYFFISKQRVRFGLIFAAIFIFLLVLAPKQFGQGVGLTRTFSITSRIGDYQQGISMWSKHPIFGVGYNRIRYIKEQLHIIDQPGVPYHSAASLSSSYLMVLVSGGAIGFVLFLGSLLKLMSIKKEITVLVLFVAVLSLFDNIILHPFIMFFLGSLLVNINLSGKSQK